MRVYPIVRERRKKKPRDLRVNIQHRLNVQSVDNLQHSASFRINRRGHAPPPSHYYSTSTPTLSISTPCLLSRSSLHLPLNLPLHLQPRSTPDEHSPSTAHHQCSQVWGSDQTVGLSNWNPPLGGNPPSQHASPADPCFRGPISQTKRRMRSTARSSSIKALGAIFGLFRSSFF
jgi:hypothetical protein